MKDFTLFKNLLTLMDTNSNVAPKSFVSFLNKIDANFLSPNEKSQLDERSKIVFSFIELFPNGSKIRSYSNMRTWLSVSLVSKLNDQLNNKLYKYILDQYRLFENEYQALLEKNVKSFINGYKCKFRY